MDLAKFTHLANNPSRTKDGLKQMLNNALSKAAEEHAAVVREVLDRRFPGWDAARRSRAGAKPTVATFRGKKRSFPAEKGAYIWLVEHFIRVKPEVFSEPSEDTVALASGRDRNYFACSPEALFPDSPHLALTRSNYAQLPNGWFANVNLSGKQSLEVLLRFGRLAKLEYGTDWQWEVLDPSEELADRQVALRRPRRGLDELRARLAERKHAG
jgi:hypothetical protein